MNEKTVQYLSQLEEPDLAWQHEIEAEAKKDRIPIMEKEGINFLKQILRIKQPDLILEIGTAIGYSALQMVDAVPNAKVITIERDLKRYHRAQFYVEQNGQSKKIDLLLGDALECVKDIGEKGPFDVVFIDAAKGQYRRFFEKFKPFLSDQGIIITDNVLFHGYVADPSLASKRLQKLAQKIDQYNQWLLNHSEFHTIFIPVGDGIAVSTKKRDCNH